MAGKKKQERGTIKRYPALSVFLIIIFLLIQPLSSKDILLHIFDGEPETIQAVFVLPGTTDHVWKILTDYKNSNKYMPIVERTRVLNVQDENTYVETLLKWGLLRFTVRSRIRAVKKKRYISWEQVDGPFTVNSGSWQLIKLTEYRTRVVYTVTVKHPLMPESVRRAVIKRSLPGLYESLKKSLQ